MIFPTTAQETAERLRTYLPEFVRPLLDRLVARVEYESAGRALDVLRSCREVGDAAPFPPDAPPAVPFHCPICERMQDAARPCALRSRAAELPGGWHIHKGGGALAELRERFGGHFDQIGDVNAWVRAVRSGDDPPATKANED